MTSESLAFSNPSVPNDIPDDHVLASKKLSNSDFRTIINTPRPSNWGKDETKMSNNMAAPKSGDNIERKKKIKKHKVKKLDSASSTVEKTPKIVPGTPYRDRARERREGKAGETGKSSPGRAEKQETRRQQIEESKYLGGDMKHTHLVKGLDYVLLEKARYDIDTKQKDAVPKIGPERIERAPIERPKEVTETVLVQSAMCKKILKFLFEDQLPKRNNNFFPGRMAYRIDLEDEFGEFDVPTTIHRSVMDCGRIDDASMEMNNNQKVIHSLTNILSYLRGERKQAKKAKQRGRIEDIESKEIIGKDFDMFADVTESDNMKRSRDDKKKVQNDKNTVSRDNKPRDRDIKERDGKVKYFDKPEEEPVILNPLEQMKQTIKNLEKKSGDKKSLDEQLFKYLKQKTNTTGYDECYPEVIESFDAMGDSDDEADYTKMDMGNKKGPVGRWDFETQEDYNKYMSNKEALPKAAFQYGVKMADGRKTRRIHNKDDKAAYDKQWKQIQDMWKSRTGEPNSKKAKF